ncbi:MAG: iron-sulfur cluster assembly scaffold protein [Planctomycetales bacterium]
MISRFSATLMDHFQYPRHTGRLSSPDVVGTAGVPGQGRFLVLYLRIHAGRVAEVSYECHGCGVTIACGSALTELVQGRTLEQCQAVTPEILSAALDGVPPDKQGIPAFALSALECALAEWRQGEPSDPSRGAGERPPEERGSAGMAVLGSVPV